MPANFLHGVETITIDSGAKPITVVKSAVVGIVGTAPMSMVAKEDQSVNTPMLILNEQSAERYFGSEKESGGYTIPKALKAVFQKGAATCVVVNVLDPGKDPATIQSSDIIGTPGEDSRTGLQALIDSYSLFGFKTKIIIAPGFSDRPEIAAEMISIADKVKGMAYIDAPKGTSFNQAISSRGTSGNLNFSDNRAMICYPTVTVYDLATDTSEQQPYSQFLAGVRAWRDQENGYWWSSSNAEISGIIGMERPLTADISDSSSEVNLLNEQGITTIFNSFGTGFRVWGNRSAAFPTYTDANNFECVLRTGDVIGDSIEYAMLQFLDRPINNALIDAIVESVRSFMRKLIADGAILDGTCWYDAADNEATEIAAGHITFRYDYMPPTPAERITFKRTLNIDYLKALGGK